MKWVVLVLFNVSFSLVFSQNEKLLNDQNGIVFRYGVGQSREPIGLALGAQVDLVRSNKSIMFDLFYAREKGPSQSGWFIVPFSYRNKDRLTYFSVLYGPMISNEKARLVLNFGPLVYHYRAAISTLFVKDGFGGQLVLGPEFKIGRAARFGIQIKAIYAHEFTVAAEFCLGIELKNLGK